MPRPKKLLCVDDHDAILRTLEMILTSAGYDVETAATATEAMRKLRDKDVDIILLDRCLPEGDGAALVPEIKRLKPHVAVVLSTADCTRGPDENELCADAIVYKPCHPNSLLQTIRGCSPHV